MTTPKNILTILLLSVYVAALGQTKTISSKIDSIRSDKDVFAFVRQCFQGYDGKESFDYYRNETRQVADSFKVRNWVKADIDNNGETDLLVFRADKLPNIYSILSFGDKFEIASAKYHCKYQFMYPVVTTLNSQDVILLYSQDQIDYDRNKKHFIYTKLACDTLIVKDKHFVNYVQAPGHNEIEKIEIYNDGICEGNCPRINISINPKTFSNKCSKELYWDNKPRMFSGQLTKEEINNIISLLKYSNITALSEYYEVGCTDQTTTTLTITFNNGQTKSIKDYGSSGNFTLAEIYKIAYGVKWTEEKGSR